MYLRVMGFYSYCLLCFGQSLPTDFLLCKDLTLQPHLLQAPLDRVITPRVGLHLQSVQVIKAVQTPPRQNRSDLGAFLNSSLFTRVFTHRLSPALAFHILSRVLPTGSSRHISCVWARGPQFWPRGLHARPGPLCPTPSCFVWPLGDFIT